MQSDVFDLDFAPPTRHGMRQLPQIADIVDGEEFTVEENALSYPVIWVNHEATVDQRSGTTRASSNRRPPQTTNARRTGV